MDISELKREKCKLKSAFTKQKHAIEGLLEAKAERVAVNKELLKLHTITDEAIERISELMDKYKETAEEDKRQQCGQEIEDLDCAYFGLEKRVRTFDSLSNNVRSNDVGNGMKRIPLFNGDKYKYLPWLSAFKACIGSNNTSPEHKLLQLRQYLRGEARRMLKGLIFLLLDTKQLCVN